MSVLLTCRFVSIKDQLIAVSERLVLSAALNGIEIDQVRMYTRITRRIIDSGAGEILRFHCGTKCKPADTAETIDTYVDHSECFIECQNGKIPYCQLKIYRVYV